MKTIKTHPFNSKLWFCYKFINLNITHGLNCNLVDKCIGYNYQGKSKGFWLNSDLDDKPSILN
jgi:hypothetical protein